VPGGRLADLGTLDGKIAETGSLTGRPDRILRLADDGLRAGARAGLAPWRRRGRRRSCPPWRPCGPSWRPDGCPPSTSAPAGSSGAAAR